MDRKISIIFKIHLSHSFLCWYLFVPTYIISPPTYILACRHNFTGTPPKRHRQYEYNPPSFFYTSHWPTINIWIYNVWICMHCTDSIPLINHLLCIVAGLYNRRGFRSSVCHSSKMTSRCTSTIRPSPHHPSLRMSSTSRLHHFFNLNIAIAIKQLINRLNHKPWFTKHLL